MAVQPAKPVPGKSATWIAQHLGLVSFFGVVVVLLLGYLLLFGPQLRKIQAANRLQQLSDEKKAKTEYLGQLRELESNFNKIPEDGVRRVAAMVPFERDLPGILATLEAAGQKAGVSLASIGFAAGGGTKSPLAVPNLQTVQINLLVTNASYERFKLFLEALEQNLRLFDVQSVGLTPDAATYTLKLIAYTQSAPL